MKYIKLFETHQEYETYINDRQNLVLPNVSFCEDTPNEVHYNPYEEPDTRLIATFSGSGSKQLYGYEHMDYNVDGATLFNSIEIDGTDVSIQELDEAQGFYEFSADGEHVVKYTLKDPTRIDSYMFYSANPKTVIIPNTVTAIGVDAFYWCNDLTTVIIPNTVTTIERYAFEDSALASVTIPNSVTSIGEYAFYMCPNLSSIEIPSGVTSIGGSAFKDCENLTSVTVKAVIPPTLGDSAFEATNCPIYVPSESVNTYKSASGWSTYASRIQAIQ